MVGHTVEKAESAERAREFIAESIESNGLVPTAVHADRGTSMTSRKVSRLLIDPGVARSHSRPKVSSDNPYSEANFKTIKYTGDFPASFDSLTHARELAARRLAGRSAPTPRRTPGPRQRSPPGLGRSIP